MTVPATATPTRTFRGFGVGLVVLLAMLFVSASAAGDGRVAFLSDRLKYPPKAGQSDDFRVRTNAALALGATNDDAAVAPLCSGLDDPNELVREAVAVALKKLARSSSLACLQRRGAVETSASVKAEIKHAEDAVAASTEPSGSTGNDAPAFAANAKYYVSVSRITNNTTRTSADIERIVHGAIASKLAELGEYQLAPSGETNDAARSALTKRHLKGYYLGVSVDKLDYSDGNLRVRVKIAVFSYPGRDLRGEVPAGATLPGARPGDAAAEDQLMSVVAARAAELFAQNFK